MLVVESLMPSGGVIFSDGIESDYLEFNAGAVGRARRAPSGRCWSCRRERCGSEKTDVQVTVDLAIFALRRGELQVLLVRRGVPPFEGRWALPGGFVREDESLEAAARRELEEETGVKDVYLEQLYTFGDPTAIRAAGWSRSRTTRS